MSTLTRTAKGIVLALGLTGAACATPPDLPPVALATTPVYVEESQADLAALRALDVVGVGELLVALPAESAACDGRPCPGWEDAVALEVERQMPRLDRLAQIASAAAESYDPHTAPPGPDELAADLQALRDLHLISVGELIQYEPVAVGTPRCHVCARPDIAFLNRARAALLHVIATEARDL